MRSILQRRDEIAGGVTWPLGRALVAPVLTVGLIVAFRDRLFAVDLSEIRTELAAIGPLDWLAAVALSALSYGALGRIDGVAHRMLRTGIGQRLGRRAGAAALALSQTLGLGILTGAVARWRLIPGLSPARALMLSTFMAVVFLGVWAWLAMAAMVLHPGMTPDTLLAARAGFWATTLIGAVLALWPSGLPRRVRRRLRASGIGLRSLAAIALYATLDMAAAAGVLFVLLAPDAGVSLAQLLPAFLIALGAGLLAGTPAGLGAFELTLISLLPGAEPAALMAAITGYRLVYFALPAMLALVALARPSLIRPETGNRDLEWHDGADLADPAGHLARALGHADLAEAHLARQPGLGLLWSDTREAGAVIGVAGHSLVMIRDPFPRLATEDVFDEFRRMARDRGLSPCYYKCGARVAVLARRRGYQVLQIAREAWLDPARYDAGTRERRQLRRKLRHAEKEGLRFEPADHDRLPLAEMSRINADWSDLHGGERGFSMGRYHPPLLAHQRLFLAWKGTELRGFVSFHVTAAEWTLDLLRPARDATDGTAHGLIDAALRAAAEAGIPRLSLAAAPWQGHEDEAEAPGSALDRLQKRLAGRTGGLGLARFKAMFDPNWEPLYIAAPTRWKLLRSGAEIARAIAHPDPFPSDKRKARHDRR